MSIKTGEEIIIAFGDDTDLLSLDQNFFKCFFTTIQYNNVGLTFVNFS